MQAMLSTNKQLVGVTRREGREAKHRFCVEFLLVFFQAWHSIQCNMQCVGHLRLPSPVFFFTYSDNEINNDVLSCTYATMHVEPLRLHEETLQESW